MSKTSFRYTCPCCGYKAFDEPPGSYSICHICFWEDDFVQLKYLASGGANPPLIDAQIAYIKYGACEERLVQFVRKPTADDVKDPAWRMIDLEKDKHKINHITDSRSYFDAAIEADPNNDDKLYYWLVD